MPKISSFRSSKPVAIWLIIGVVMLMIQVLLGGITRLTGSGLSITEWNPIMGALPPLHEQDWQRAFQQYQQIGQYKQLNFDFTLSDFKVIYFWEWFHRLWARLIAVVFLVPFVIFLVQKRFRPEMVIPMVILFLLGALQGALGWIMVQSGLNEEDVYVSHIRLAVHFLAAMVLVCYTFWFALQLLLPPVRRLVRPQLKNFTVVIVFIYSIQLLYGAWMAGLKAAPAAPTWPSINGHWIPQLGHPVNDAITVQFIHRGIAYLVAILSLVWWLRSRRVVGSTLFQQTKLIPLLLVLVQIVLGIITVVNSGNTRSLLWLGAAHQFVAMLLLLVWVWMLFLIRRKARLGLS